MFTIMLHLRFALLRSKTSTKFEYITFIFRVAPIILKSQLRIILDQKPEEFKNIKGQQKAGYPYKKKWKYEDVSLANWETFN